MPYYFIVRIKMLDSETYDNYLKEASAVFTRYKGKYISVDNNFKVIEGKDESDRVVIIQFKTEEDFNQTLDLVNQVRFEGTFTFVYSKRDGTPAAKFDDNVLHEEKKQRLYKLNESTNKYYLEGNKRFEDEVVEVLVDSVSKNDDSMMSGYSRHNKLVNFKGSKDSVGKIVKVRIIEAKTWHLLGEQVI